MVRYVRVHDQGESSLGRGGPMKLALCGMSALRVLRDLRQRHVDVMRLPRVDLPAPSLEGSGRWSRAAI